MDENRSLPASCLSLSLCHYLLFLSLFCRPPKGIFWSAQCCALLPAVNCQNQTQSPSLREALWRPLKCLSLYFPFRQTNKFPTSVLPLFSTPGMLSSASLRTQSLHEEEDIPFLFKLVLHFTPSLLLLPVTSIRPSHCTRDRN